MALDNTQISNYTDKTTIKNWFKTGLKPTQTQFWSTWDSFWHKSESLPISSISGLGNLLDGKAETEHTHSEYAKNDATSLTAENVTAWQNKLGINDLDYVVIPTDDATEQSYPYVVVIDNEGNSARRNATDFGKVDTIDGIEADENKDVKLGAVRKSESNTVTEDFSMQQENGAYVSIASNGLKVGFGGITATYGTSSISVDNLVIDSAYKFQELLFPKRAVKNEAEKVYPVTYVQGVKADETGRVDISGLAMNWMNPSHRWSNLADKSSDATFNGLMGLDSNGYAGKITQSANLFEKTLQGTTSEQALRIGNLLNGGNGSSGAMSVNTISPPIIQNRYDINEYVVLRGANLLLSNIDMKVEILGADKTTVVAEIPNNQVINQNAVELVFYYNFSTLPEGDYYIRLRSGVKVYVSDLVLTIIDYISNIDLNSITWEYVKSDDIEMPVGNLAVGNNITLISTGQLSININQSYKSNEIFAQGENFYVEFEINTFGEYSPYVEAFYRNSFGVGYSDTPNLLFTNSVVYVSRSKPLLFNNDRSVMSGDDADNRIIVCSIKKVGNILTTVVGNVVVNTVVSKDSGYSLFAQSMGNINHIRVQTRITKAFKLN